MLYNNLTGKISSFTEINLFSDPMSKLYDTLFKVSTKPPTDIKAAIGLVSDKYVCLQDIVNLTNIVNCLGIP